MSASRNTGAQNPCAGSSFALRIQPEPGLSQRQEVCFEHQLAIYLQEHDLQSDGTPLHLVVRSDHRELSATDQVDLLLWLFDTQPVCRVSLGALVDEPDAAGQGVWIRAESSDLALWLLLMLYRLGRTNAQTVLHILGGDRAPPSAAP